MSIKAKQSDTDLIKSMIGNWSAVDRRPGETFKHISELLGDGTFRVNGIHEKNGKILFFVNHGSWSINNGALTYTIQESNIPEWRGLVVNQDVEALGENKLTIRSASGASVNAQSVIWRSEAEHLQILAGVLNA